MDEYWIAAGVGAISGGALLAAIHRMQARGMIEYAFLVFAMMLAIYLGARLVTGTMATAALEFLAINIILGLVRFAIERWPATIGVAILLHGAYDALLGPHTGVAEWYPPLCAGFDLVVGAGLLVLLQRKANDRVSGSLY